MLWIYQCLTNTRKRWGSHSGLTTSQGNWSCGYPDFCFEAETFQLFREKQYVSPLVRKPPDLRDFCFGAIQVPQALDWLEKPWHWGSPAQPCPEKASSLPVHSVLLRLEQSEGTTKLWAVCHCGPCPTEPFYPQCLAGRNGFDLN